VSLLLSFQPPHPLIYQSQSVTSQGLPMLSTSFIEMMTGQKVLVVGGGPVGALTALYAARRGYQVELYDLRDG
jgi:NADPH-dependent 2,4-dienoyl-CoA reductase/sulfur reductase-like enzyme